jgi:hypothetical protein
VGSLKSWLRAKGGLYSPWLIICFLSALMVPIAMQMIDARLPVDGGWEHTTWFARLHARTGASWWLAAWLSPMGFVAAISFLYLGMESLIFGLRLDPNDHAWSSVRWALGGWRTILAWILAPILLAMLVAYLAEPLAQPVAWAAFMLAAFAAPLLSLLLPFFVTKADYLAADRPPLRSRPRWPGARAVLLWLFVFLGLPLLALLPTEKAPWPVLVLLLVAFVLLAIVVSIAAQLAWLNCGLGAGEAIRRALQPRVFLAVFVQGLRWYGWGLLVLLPLLPAAVFLVGIAPLLEDQLAVMGPQEVASRGLMRMVHASRFAVSWWWAALGVGSLVLQPCLAWLGVAGAGRLLVELGEVGERPGAEAQDSVPSGFLSAK